MSVTLKLRDSQAHALAAILRDDIKLLEDELRHPVTGELGRRVQRAKLGHARKLLAVIETTLGGAPPPAGLDLVDPDKVEQLNELLGEAVEAQRPKARGKR